MGDASYHQFCPVAMAAEVLGSRWTLVLLRELCAGSTRFNDLRRGVPRMSPALLSKRLRELEASGIVERVQVRKRPELHEYRLTAAGRDLAPVVEAVGIWGQRWIETEPSLENTDAGLLMWDMRRAVRPEPLPRRRVVVQFIYSDQPPARRDWWLLIEPEGETDLCSVDPGFDVDLFVRCALRTMTAIWMGVKEIDRAVADDDLMLVGPPEITRDMSAWLGLSPFAVEPKRVP